MNYTGCLLPLCANGQAAVLRLHDGERCLPLFTSERAFAAGSIFPQGFVAVLFVVPDGPALEEAARHDGLVIVLDQTLGSIVARLGSAA